MRPGTVILLCIPVFAVAAALCPSYPFDLQLYDTYYLVDYWMAVQLTGIYFLLVGTLYVALLNAAGEPWMNWSHTVTTLLFPFLLLLHRLPVFNLAGVANYLDPVDRVMRDASGMLLLTTGILFLAGQLVLLANLVLATFRN